MDADYTIRVVLNVSLLTMIGLCVWSLIVDYMNDGD